MKWFKHDSNANRDDKLGKVLLRYGADGYALYWLCLELIANRLDSEHADFELKHDSEVLANILNVDSARIEEIMQFFISLKLFEHSEGIITCLKLSQRLDQSTIRNLEIRKITEQVRTSTDKYRQVQTSTTRLDKIRLDKIRLDKIKDSNISQKKYGSEKNVHLTESQFQSLIADFGNDMVLRYIETLSQGKAMKGYQYKRDDLAIRKWIKKDEQDKKPVKKIGMLDMEE